MAAVRLKKYVGGRLRRLRGILREKDLAGLIVTDPAEVRYLTGFSGDDSVFLLTERRKMMVTDSRYVVQLRDECPGLARKVRQGAITEAVGEVLSGWGVIPRRRRKRPPVIGVDPEGLTAGQYRSYRKVIGKGLRPIKEPVKPLRQCKDDYEIAQIRRAVRVAEAALQRVLEELKVGMTEQETAARLEYEMSRRGGGPAAFESIVAFGAHAAQPHARPGRKRLGKRDTLLFDWGAQVEGYRSDLTRCFAVGRIPAAFRDVYRCVLDAQLAAIAEVRPGVALCDVDAAARKVLREGLKGLPGRFAVYGHGTGHGLGLDVHEGPFFSPRSKGVLEEGMVMTIEPGVYVPGRFGIRIEDDVLVTARGRTVLSRMAKDLSSVGLEGTG